MSDPDVPFQITLPSNASTNLFPENRANSYRTKLCKALNLGGSDSEWEVALVDIAFPQNWQNILESTEIEVWHEKIDPGLETIPPEQLGIMWRKLAKFTVPKGNYACSTGGTIHAH